MKKTFNRVKSGITAFGIVVFSFFSKVFGQSLIGPEYWTPPMQSLYGEPSPEPSIFVTTIVKVIQRLLVGATFILGIVNLIKIKKTDDKTQKGKRIKKTIIVMSILIILIVACFITKWLLKK